MGQVLFLMPNQEYQSAEGIKTKYASINEWYYTSECCSEDLKDSVRIAPVCSG